MFYEQDVISLKCANGDKCPIITTVAHISWQKLTIMKFSSKNIWCIWCAWLSQHDQCKTFYTPWLFCSFQTNKCAFFSLQATALQMVLGDLHAVWLGFLASASPASLGGMLFFSFSSLMGFFSCISLSFQPLNEDWMSPLMFLGSWGPLSACLSMKSPSSSHRPLSSTGIVTPESDLLQA